jgi:hypothetical protein
VEIKNNDIDSNEIDDCVTTNAVVPNSILNDTKHHPNNDPKHHPTPELNLNNGGRKPDKRMIASNNKSKIENRSNDEKKNMNKNKIQHTKDKKMELLDKKKSIKNDHETTEIEDVHVNNINNNDDDDCLSTMAVVADPNVSTNACCST